MRLTSIVDGGSLLSSTDVPDDRTMAFGRMAASLPAEKEMKIISKKCIIIRSVLMNPQFHYKKVSLGPILIRCVRALKHGTYISS